MRKLNPAQQHIVGRMKEGWQLWVHWGLTPNAWLYKRVPDHCTEAVKIQTFFALHDRGLLSESRIGDKALYILNLETAKEE